MHQIWHVHYFVNDIFHINWIVLSTGDFRCYIAAKQTILSIKLDISELTAGSLARIVMILIEAQMKTTKEDLNLIQLIAMSWTDLNLSFKNLIHSERHNSKKYKIIEILPIKNYQTMPIQYILSWASICLQYSWQFFKWKMSNVNEGKIQHIALFENLKLE